MNLGKTKLTDLKQELYNLIDSWDNIRVLNSNTLYYIWHGLRISKTNDVYSVAMTDNTKDIEISNKYIIYLLIEDMKKEKEIQLNKTLIPQDT